MTKYLVIVVGNNPGLYRCTFIKKKRIQEYLDPVFVQFVSVIVRSSLLLALKAFTRNNLETIEIKREKIS